MMTWPCLSHAASDDGSVQYSHPEVSIALRPKTML